MIKARGLAAIFLCFFGVWASAESSFQQDIDSAFVEIMDTQVGRSICHDILGANADMIQFHLGVTNSAALQIAQACADAKPNHWIFPTASDDISKLNLKPSLRHRKYALLSANVNFPIESWTDPFTNTTTLVAGHDGISHERLVQLLAHETAVYFDAKSNPAHPDAQMIPAMHGLALRTSDHLDPLVAVTDPLVAHTLTFVRALQVEYQIVDELIRKRKIVPPADHFDPYLNFLISDRCQETCLENLILRMRGDYLPISLPLLAFSPQFRSLLSRDITRVQPDWTQEQWARMQSALNTLPAAYLKNQFTGNSLADLQKVFRRDESSRPAFQVVSDFLESDLFPLEWPSLTGASLSSGQRFLEFMKVPLMSGYNIRLSSGPRVRVTTGTIE